MSLLRRLMPPFAGRQDIVTRRSVGASVVLSRGTSRCHFCHHSTLACCSLSNPPTSTQLKPSIVALRKLSKLSYQEDELYDKSYITFLKKENENHNIITSFSNHGFKLNDTNEVVGPMILLASCILHWRIQHARDITPESLKLFTLLHPKPDIVVLGTGDEIVPLSHECRELLRKHRIAVEVQKTENAVATYNFLSVEDRIVVGAFCLVTREAVLKKMMASDLYDENEPYATESESTDSANFSQSSETETSENDGGHTEENIEHRHTEASSVEAQKSDDNKKTKKRQNVSGRIIDSNKE